MTVLPSPIPHPLDALPWEVPDWAYECLEWVIGVQWPEGDERAVWDLADAWFAAAADLDVVRTEATTAAAAVTAGYAGPAATAFFDQWEAVSAPLGQLPAFFADLGAGVESCGAEIEAAKIEVWIEVGLLVIELLALTVAIALTAGAASPAAMAAAAATRAAIQRIFGRLVTRLSASAVKSASSSTVRRFGRQAAVAGAAESVEEVATSAGIQSYQRAAGHRQSWDLRALGMSAVGGLAGGVAGSAAHIAPNPAAGMVAKSTRAAASEALAETAASLATGAGLPDPTDAARAATSGATSGAIDHGLMAAEVAPHPAAPASDPRLDPASLHASPAAAPSDLPVARERPQEPTETSPAPPAGASWSPAGHAGVASFPSASATSGSAQSAGAGAGSGAAESAGIPSLRSDSAGVASVEAASGGSRTGTSALSFIEAESATTPAELAAPGRPDTLRSSTDDDGRIHTAAGGVGIELAAHNLGDQPVAEAVASTANGPGRPASLAADAPAAEAITSTTNGPQRAASVGSDAPAPVGNASTGVAGVGHQTGSDRPTGPDAPDSASTMPSRPSAEGAVPTQQAMSPPVVFGGGPAGDRTPPSAAARPEVMLRDPTPDQLRAIGIGSASFADLGVDPDSLTAAERSRYERLLPKVALLRPDQIRFTQRSVSPTTHDLDGPTAQIRPTGWHGPPIHGVRWGDGSYVTFDNQLLRAAREAGLDRVPIVIHTPSERLSDWPDDWPPDRIARHALSDQIRELSDGTWSAGGDLGSAPPRARRRRCDLRRGGVVPSRSSTRACFLAHSSGPSEHLSCSVGSRRRVRC